jgi:hypothetical protein
MYVPQYEITSVDLDYEDGRKLLTTLGRTLSGIPDGPGPGAALAIGQRLVAHGQLMGSCVPVRVRAACVLVLLTRSRNSGARAHVHVPRACARRVRIGVADQVKKFLKRPGSSWNPRTAWNPRLRIRLGWCC